MAIRPLPSPFEAARKSHTLSELRIMTDDRNFHQFVGTTTDVSVLLKQLCIIALLCLLFFWPEGFKSWLSRAGISQVHTPLGDIDIKETGGAVANANRGLLDALRGLQQIQSSDPHTSGQLQPIIGSLNELQQQVAATDASIKTTLVAQQATLAQTSPQTTTIPGWLLAGHVQKDKANWFGDSIQIVPTNLSPILTIGEKVNVTSIAYLRADAPPGQHFTGKVIGVVPANGQVQVIASPEYSPALAGGYFLWVKVQPL